MGAFADFDSGGVFKFGFMLDGIESKTIKSIDGLSLKMDKVETRSNSAGGKPIHKVWAGNKQFLGQITATRVMTDDPTWHDWYQEALHHIATARKTGVVNIYSNDSTITAPVRTYTFTHAWPIELKITGMNAATAAPIEESVTFMYEELIISPA
ncbi:MAG TPA: phage tail protein [Acidimicrobiales bacterium]|jgi:phage tail-like protein|nr:phage tail protein [Acidimicrobiales bacterium]